MNRWRGIIEEYRKFLPVTAQTPVITLGEGNTPLIRAARLAKKIAPGIDLYLKYEGMNPTGSFKDRGMTMAISKAVEGGARAVICASTGNTSASAAAYGARAGIAVYVLIPAGKIALGKLSQAMMHQATVIQVEGNFDQALGERDARRERLLHRLRQLGHQRRQEQAGRDGAHAHAELRQVARQRR